MSEKRYNLEVYDEPLQNYLDTKSNVSEFIRTILDDFRTGVLLRKEDIQYDEELKIEKLKKIKKENLSYDLKNWKELKSSGHIFEEAKAIILRQKELESSSLQNYFHKCWVSFQ